MSKIIIAETVIAKKLPVNLILKELEIKIKAKIMIAIENPWNGKIRVPPD